MAITYQSISTVATKTSGFNGPLTLNAPAGLTTGDLLVACISFRGAGTPSLPTSWNLIQRTTVTGNTSVFDSVAVGSGLMAWIRRSIFNPSFEFGGTIGQGFPDLALGYVIRITGADPDDPVAGFSVNTLDTPGSTVTTPGYTRSFNTQDANDYIEIMNCIGAQEVSWSFQQYANATQMSEIGEATDTFSLSNGSISVARSLSAGNTTVGFQASASYSSRHSLMVASFGGPRSTSVGHSFYTFL